MKKYKVVITRTQVTTMDFEVNGDDIKTAEAKAYDMAVNAEWNNGYVEYVIDSGEELDEAGAKRFWKYPKVVR